jgi:hypothetical protein
MAAMTPNVRFLEDATSNPLLDWETVRITVVRQSGMRDFEGTELSNSYGARLLLDKVNVC